MSNYLLLCQDIAAFRARLCGQTVACGVTPYVGMLDVNLGGSVFWCQLVKGRADGSRTMCLLYCFYIGYVCYQYVSNQFSLEDLLFY